MYTNRKSFNSSHNQTGRTESAGPLTDPECLEWCISSQHTAHFFLIRIIKTQKPHQVALLSPTDWLLANLYDDDKPKTLLIQRIQVHWCPQVRSTWLLHDKSRCVRNKWCSLTSVQTIILQTINLLREKFSNLTWKLLNSLCIQIFSSIVMVFEATHERHVSKMTCEDVSELAEWSENQ